MADLKCLQCGKCCMQAQNLLYATKEDMERWEKEGRNDILKLARPEYKHGEIVVADIWIDPKTGLNFFVCPWLKRKGDKRTCSIHKTKPRICRDYFCPDVRRGASLKK